MLLIIIALLYKGCGSSTIPTAPIIVNPVIIQDTIKADSIKFQIVINKWKDSTTYLNSIISSQQTSIIKIDKQKFILQNTLDTSTSPNKKDVNSYINESNKRDTICDGIVANQKIQLSIKDTILNKKQSLYDSLYKAFNFLATQSEVQKSYTDSLQPKNEVYFGGGLYGNKSSFIQGVDIGIFLKTKRDRVYKFDIIDDFSKGLNYALSTYFKIHLK